MKPNDERFLRCRVSRGFFESELYVIVASSSVFVDRDQVRVQSPPTPGQDVEGQVRAYIIVETKDKALVELPGQAVVGGLRMWVPKGDLAVA